MGRRNARRAVRRRLESFLGDTTLTPAEIAQLAQQAIPRRYAADELIIRQGAHGDFWGLVTKGQVVASSARGDGSLRQSARVLHRGATFGESMLLEGQPSAQTLRAARGTEVYVLRRVDLLTLARQRRCAPSRRPEPRRKGLVAAFMLGLPVVLLAGIVITRLAAPASDQTSAGSEGSRSSLGHTARILSPASGQVVQRSVSVRVEAELTEPDIALASLEVDGQVAEKRARPASLGASWLQDWIWLPSSEGTHTFRVRAEWVDNRIAASEPVTIVVVPDGSLIFASNRDGYYAVYSMGTDGRQTRRVATGPGQTRQVVVSRQGALAFVVEQGTDQAVIRWIGPGQDQADDLTVGRDPAWSWQGDRLAYAAAVDGVSQVFVAGTRGKPGVQVTSEPVYGGQPTWSPDGNSLAYVAERDGNLDIWVVNLLGGQPQRLTSDPAMDWAPAWSPDGSRLAFVSSRTGRPQIHVMRTNGEGVIRLTGLPQGAEQPTWSPDGHWLAFVAYSGQGIGVNAREVYLMQADGAVLARLTENAFDDSHPMWAGTP